MVVPEGYTISIFAEDLGAARFMALDPDGVLYVTDRQGRVLRLPDADGDDVADDVETVLDGLNTPHGITFHDGALYVAEETRVIRASDADGDGTFETVETIIDGLERAPEAFLALFAGDNVGKMLVRVGPDS